jgi:hypothetical protein
VKLSRNHKRDIVDKKTKTQHPFKTIEPELQATQPVLQNIYEMGETKQPQKPTDLSSMIDFDIFDEPPGK